VSNLPFGFGPPSGDDDPDRSGNPFAGTPFEGLLGGDPAALGMALQQLGQMLSTPSAGPVNWDLARDVARQAVAAAQDPSQGPAEHAAVAEAMRLADLWLDPVTVLPAGTASAVAWSRAEWVEATLPAWRQLVDPVAARVVEAMGGAMPAEMQAAAGPLLGMIRQMGGAMFGTQIGQAVGQLATEVVGATDVGLPLGPEGRAALLPTNIEAFGAGLGLPADQVRLYLALREAAHHRLFGHVPWLRQHLFAAVEAYAAGINVNSARLEEAVGQLDPSNPEALQEALASGMFEPEETPAQQAALLRLETALALVEGWVDTVVNAAASPHLPGASAMRETVRRRRASGGPAEQTFASLVGLELRPRRLREAAALWSALAEARGIEGRDAVWAHPDLLPGPGDLDDPETFVDRAGDALAPLDLSALEGLEPGHPEDADPQGAADPESPEDPPPAAPAG